LLEFYWKWFLEGILKSKKKSVCESEIVNINIEPTYFLFHISKIFF
jgi:hypothetical protein